MMQPTDSHYVAELILPTAYLAPISWYSRLLRTNGAARGTATAPDGAMIEQWETFPKQTLRNRCQIAGPNGIQMLTVPVCHCESKQYTKEVKINYQSHWQHLHLMALRSAYRHTPYYVYLIDELDRKSVV